MGDPQYMRFSVEEFRVRCDRARELMGKRGINGLFITEGRNYTYFSGGTRDNSNARPHVMILPREGDPVAIIQRFPEWNRRKGIWFDDIRIYDTMLGLPLEMTVEVMKEKGLGEGRVGVELGHEQKLGMDTGDFLKLKELLHKVEFVGTADVFWNIRMIKSPEEITRSRRACEITILAYEALFPNLYEGVIEKEIMDRFLKLQMNIGGSSPWGSMNSGPENYLNNSGGPPHQSSNSKRRPGLAGRRVFLQRLCE
ncbi:aminopeptidase P family N-terminal domain-containing protein [Chloroflexota bacterium]